MVSLEQWHNRVRIAAFTYMFLLYEIDFEFRELFFFHLASQQFFRQVPFGAQ